MSGVSLLDSCISQHLSTQLVRCILISNRRFSQDWGYRAPALPIWSSLGTAGTRHSSPSCAGKVRFGWGGKRRTYSGIKGCKTKSFHEAGCTQTQTGSWMAPRPDEGTPQAEGPVVLLPGAVGTEAAVSLAVLKLEEELQWAPENGFCHHKVAFIF